MAKRTKKRSSIGRFGTRYGIKIRRQTGEVEKKEIQKYECPRCKFLKVRRMGSGIWYCKHCNIKFAGGAYQPVVVKVLEEGEKNV
ncbi:MAG: 50S ribosomal protein L37ae [Candidatus Thermoplasmatota archaeon]